MFYGPIKFVKNGLNGAWKMSVDVWKESPVLMTSYIVMIFSSLTLLELVRGWMEKLRKSRQPAYAIVVLLVIFQQLDDAVWEVQNLMRDQIIKPYSDKLEMNILKHALTLDTSAVEDGELNIYAEDKLLSIVTGIYYLG